MHTLAWLVWLGAAVSAISLTRNPFYLLLLWLSMLIVGASLRTRSDVPDFVIPSWRFALLMISLAAVFNALTSHYGQNPVFVIPGRVPLLSGPVTLEALVYGAINGLVLAGFFTAFGVLNQAVPVHTLVRMIPRAFYPVAVVTALAVTYIPVTLRQFRQVREAQAVRGHRIRGLRDWYPLLIPLLVSGLEHALALSEAMTARGFASSLPFAESNRPRLMLLIGLGLLAAGWLWRLTGRASGLALMLMIGGMFLIAVGLRALGRLAPRTTYRSQIWQTRDTLVCLALLPMLILFLIPLPGLGHEALFYNPYPLLSLPPFEPLPALAVLGLLFPLIVMQVTND